MPVDPIPITGQRPARTRLKQPLKRRTRTAGIDAKTGEPRSGCQPQPAALPSRAPGGLVGVDARGSADRRVRFLIAGGQSVGRVGFQRGETAQRDRQIEGGLQELLEGAAGDVASADEERAEGLDGAPPGGGKRPREGRPRLACHRCGRSERGTDTRW